MSLCLGFSLQLVIFPLLSTDAINGMIQNMKTASCLSEGSQNEKKTTRPFDYLTLFEIKIFNKFLISNFRYVLNIVFFLLGDPPAYEFYMPTFWNTLYGPSSWAM